MLELMAEPFGPVRGGLGYSTIIVGFILGAITGTVAAAEVIAMAMITLPVMLRYKYNMPATPLACWRPRAPSPSWCRPVAGADRAGRPARALGRRHDRRPPGGLPSCRSRSVFFLPAYTFYVGTSCGPTICPPVPANAVRQGPADQAAPGASSPAMVLILPRAGHHHDGPGRSCSTEAGAMGTIGRDRRLRPWLRNAPLAPGSTKGLVRRPALHRPPPAVRFPDRAGGALQVARLPGRPSPVMFAAIILAVLAGLAVQGIARAHHPGLPQADDAHHRDGGVHPGRRDALLHHLPGRRRPPLGRTPYEGLPVGEWAS